MVPKQHDKLCILLIPGACFPQFEKKKRENKFLEKSVFGKGMWEYVLISMNEEYVLIHRKHPSYRLSMEKDKASSLRSPL